MGLMSPLLPLLQVLSRGMTDQTMRIKSLKLENKQLQQRLADKGALWRDLQHDLVALNAVPEGKGRRQQVSVFSLRQYIAKDRHMLCVRA